MIEITCCPMCGGKLEEWHNDIYECKDCESMYDLEVFEELEEKE